MVQQLSDDEHMITRQDMLASLDVAMGGRAAEELVFGPSKVTQGAASDFQHATLRARKMVTHCGMSEKIGKIFLDAREGTISAETQNLVDSEVRALLEQSYARAQALLAAHKHELQLLSEALLEHETLSLEDIKLAISGKTLPARVIPQPLPPAPHVLPTPIHTPTPASLPKPSNLPLPSYPKPHLPAHLPTPAPAPQLSSLPTQTPQISPVSIPALPATAPPSQFPNLDLDSNSSHPNFSTNPDLPNSSFPASPTTAEEQTLYK
jgi:ATP-dependent metalloprotease